MDLVRGRSVEELLVGCEVGVLGWIAGGVEGADVSGQVCLHATILYSQNKMVLGCEPLCRERRGGGWMSLPDARIQGLGGARRALKKGS